MSLSLSLYIYISMYMCVYIYIYIYIYIITHNTAAQADTAIEDLKKAIAEGEDTAYT